MARLGYARYGAQGGDWGSMISNLLGVVDPEHCLGIHLNMVFAGHSQAGAFLTGQTIIVDGGIVVAPG